MVTNFLSARFVLACILTLGAVVTHAYAGACTYDEAILALKQGNAVRGMALLAMASRDGDQRATTYLALGNSKNTDLLQNAKNDFDSMQISAENLVRRNVLDEY